VPVTVVEVGTVRVSVAQGMVPMRMAVRLGSLVAAMAMLMVRIVRVQVLVLEGFVGVLVRVILSQNQRHPHGHEQPSARDCRSGLLAQKGDGEHAAHEGRRGKERPRPGGTEVPKCPHIQEEARPGAHGAQREAECHGTEAGASFSGGPSEQGGTHGGADALAHDHRARVTKR